MTELQGTPRAFVSWIPGVSLILRLSKPILLETRLSHTHSARKHPGLLLPRRLLPAALVCSAVPACCSLCWRLIPRSRWRWRWWCVL